MSQQGARRLIGLRSMLAQGLAMALPSNTLRRFVAPNFRGGSGPDALPLPLPLPLPSTLDGAGSATAGFTSAGSASVHVE